MDVGCDYFSTINFMEYKYRSSISNGNLVSELKYVLNIKYTPDFKYILINKSIYIYIYTLLYFIIILYLYTNI